MVAIYIVLTAYLLVCSCPPRTAFFLRDALAPFQIKVRARKAEAERSATVWRSLQFETRTPRHAAWCHVLSESSLVCLFGGDAPARQHSACPRL